MKHLPFALAPLALAMTATALADDAPVLNTVNVTADRSLMPVTQQLDNTTVITRADIERIQPATVGDLLATQSGLTIANSGGPMLLTTVSMRGFAANKVLVVIDGMRANDATSGSFDFSTLRPEDIERIEIVHGGYSSQWGSDAMGGVIQIFTRKNVDNSVTLRAGSQKTNEESLTLGTRGDKGGVSAGLSMLNTSGIPVADKNFVAANGFTPEPGSQGGNQRTLRLAGDRQLDHDITVNAMALLKDGNLAYDNGLTASTYAQTGVTLNQRVNSWYKYQVDVGYLQNKQNSNDWSGLTSLYFPYPASSTNYETQRYNLDWINTLTHPVLGVTTVGLNLVQENVSVDGSASSGLVPVAQRNSNDGVFLTNEQNIGNFSYRASGRFDHYEAWGDHSTGSLRLGYKITPTLQAFAGYGSNFRAPTVNELYGSYGAGNPNLQPETSQQQDIGLAWHVAPQHQIKVTAYRADVHDLISYGPAYTLVNINSARMQGIETEASGQFGDTGYQLTFTRARAIDESTTPNGQISRQPRAQLTGDIHHRFMGRVTVGAQVVSRSNTADYPVDTQGFAVFNAYASWTVCRKLDLGLHLDNLANKFYETVRGYSTPGRSAYVTARYRF